jgi:hypothetical protein
VDFEDGGAPRAGVSLEAFESAVQGVIDMVKLEVRARPLVAGSSRTAHRALDDSGSDVEVVVRPVERRYLGEDPLPR